MMGFDDFYQIADYASENWKGNFSPREIANNTYDYLCEFELSKVNEEPTHTIKELCKLLAEDGSYECRWWLGEIAEELNLIDIDWHGYLDTDDWLEQFIKADGE